MAVQVNVVIFAGNLTKDPQVKFLANDNAVAKFTLANNRKFKGSDGQLKQEACFIDVEAWGKTAELVGQYLTKGSGALVEGELRQDTWQDADGKQRTKLKLVAKTVQFTTAKKENEDHGTQQQPEPEPKPSRPSQSSDHDEPPF